jgi:FKBP-type peptidyl-prolyl cis-trans isomerase FklB
MKISILALASLISLGLASHVAAQDAKAAPQASSPAAPALPDALKDPKAQFGYAIGLNLGATMKRDGVVLDPAMLARGVSDAYSGAKPLMSEDQAHAALGQLKASMDAQRQAAAVKAARW